MTTLRDSRRTTLRRPRPGASDAPTGGGSTTSDRSTPAILSHAEMFAHDVGRELAERAAGRAVSFVETVELPGDPPRKRQLLLDEKNGDTSDQIVGLELRR